MTTYTFEICANIDAPTYEAAESIILDLPTTITVTSYQESASLPPLPESHMRLFDLIRRAAEEWTGDEDTAERIANDATNVIIATANREAK